MRKPANRDGGMAAREAALQMLYARALAGQDIPQIERWYLDAHPLPPEMQLRAAKLLAAAVAHEARIDDLIRRHAIGWRLERISIIDRCLLTVAIAELLSEATPAASATIQAALRLAKRFSQPEAVGFIGGLLEAIARALKAETTAVAH